MDTAWYKCVQRFDGAPDGVNVVVFRVGERYALDPGFADSVPEFLVRDEAEGGEELPQKDAEGTEENGVGDSAQRVDAFFEPEGGLVAGPVYRVMVPVRDAAGAEFGPGDCVVVADSPGLLGLLESGCLRLVAADEGETTENAESTKGECVGRLPDEAGACGDNYRQYSVLKALDVDGDHPAIEPGQVVGMSAAEAAALVADGFLEESPGAEGTKKAATKKKAPARRKRKAKAGAPENKAAG